MLEGGGKPSRIASSFPARNAWIIMNLRAASPDCAG